ncbi:MAG TPA: cyclic nucleotide-binding domain-containing protein [Holophagaceae bacterium]|nr:cyclic nucleotide-binding domain-containing protein [Holophagaceae bacterium]
MPDLLESSRLPPDAFPEVGRLLGSCPDIGLLRFRDGEALVQEGAEDRCLYLVLSGSLVITRMGEQLAGLECSPDHPAIVGEMAYFGARMRTATVAAVGASQALRLQPEHLDLIMAEYPDLTRLLCRQFTWRLQESNEALQTLQRRFDLAPQRRMANDGEVLFRAGDPPQGLMQVMMGAIRLEQDGIRRVVAPHDLPEGFLEPEAYLRGRPHRFTAVAEGSAFIVTVPPDRKEAVIRTFPGVVMRLLEGRL